MIPHPDDDSTAERVLNMRIACLSRITLAHQTKGGMEVHLQTTAEGLARLGHDVTVYTTASDTGERIAVLGGIPHYFLDAPAGRYRPAWARASQQVVKEMRHSHSVDILWGQGAGAEAVAQLPRHQRPPLVTLLHGTFLGELRSRVRNLHSTQSVALALLMLWRFITWHNHIQRAEHVIVLTSLEEQTLRRWFHNLPPITVIPNGIDVDLFAPDRAARRQVRLQLNIPQHTHLIIAVGRLVRAKGMHLALACLQDPKIQDTHLLIVGTGREEQNLGRLANALGVHDRVHFTGYVERTELPAYYSAADLFVMPTLCNEGLPLTLIEAMACGLPSVATDIGGISTVIDQHENGILIPMGDRGAMVNAIDQLLNNPEYSYEVARNARAKAVSRYSLERMVRDIEDVLKQTVTRYASQTESISTAHL